MSLILLFFPNASAGKNEEEDHCQHFTSSADSEKENDSLMPDVMEQYRQHIVLEKEHAELTKKVEKLSFQSKMVSRIFSYNNRRNNRK